MLYNNMVFNIVDAFKNDLGTRAVDDDVVPTVIRCMSDGRFFHVSSAAVAVTCFQTDFSTRESFISLSLSLSLHPPVTPPPGGYAPHLRGSFVEIRTWIII